MHIQASRLLPYCLTLRRSWRTNNGVLSERRGWIVELISDRGMKGYGDCAPLEAAGTESALVAEAWLTTRLPLTHQQEPAKIIGALPQPAEAPSARHALETALLDLVSHAAGCSLRHWLSSKAVDQVGVNASAGRLDEDAMERSQPLLEQGFSTLKFKVGATEIDQELSWLQQLDKHLPAHIRLRLDANGAWDMREAKMFLREIPLRVESLEEPLETPVPERLAQLQEMTHTALALDESLTGLSIKSLLQKPPIRRLIIKPTVLGGLLPSMALASQAAKAGMQTLVTSTLESAVGIQAAAQLAAAIHRPEAPLEHGLATSEWLSNDVAEAPKITQGRLMLSDASGLGIKPYGSLSGPSSV